MTDLKISALTDGGAIQDGDQLVIARSGANYKVDIEELLPAVVTALPSTPSTGDECYYKAGTGDTAVLWHLKYDSTITDAHKWRVIGAQDLQAEVATEESGTSTTYADLTTVGPEVTVPLAGVYEISFGAWIVNLTNGDDAWISVALGTTAVDADGLKLRAVGSSPPYDVKTLSRTLPRRTLAASAVVELKYRVSAGTIDCSNRWLTVRPVRLG